MEQLVRYALLILLSVIMKTGADAKNGYKLNQNIFQHFPSRRFLIVNFATFIS